MEGESRLFSKRDFRGLPETQKKNHRDLTYRQLYDKFRKKYRLLFKSELDRQVMNILKGKEPSSEGIKQLIKELHISAGLYMARSAYRQVKKQGNRKSEMTPEEKWRTVIINFLQNNGLDKLAQDITNTTKEDIRRILIQSQQEGWSISKTSLEIEKKGLTAYRGELIARTETTRAANQGAMIGALSTGLRTVKEWISISDDRTRRIPRDNYDHLHMDGKQSEMDQAFVVPSLRSLDLMQFPGDPNGAAGNVCNCRCTVGFEVVRDSRLQPIRIQDGPALTGPIGQLYGLLIDDVLLTITNILQR